MSVLSIQDVSIRFGGVQALSQVSLEVNEWEIVGLIGPNGAGKTTLFNCISGFYRQNEGRISFKDTDISEMAPNQRAALGIARTFQHVGLVRSMPILENLLLAQHLAVRYAAAAGILGLPQTFFHEKELEMRAMRVLEFMGLSDLAGSSLKGLPYGTLKAVEVAAVLATDPEIILLDEPAAGMGPEESFEFGDRVREMRKELGVTVVMIDHHVPLIVRVCDYVYCLNFGQMIADGEPEAVRRHPEVVTAYLGEEVEDGAA